MTLESAEKKHCTGMLVAGDIEAACCHRNTDCMVSVHLSAAGGRVSGRTDGAGEVPWRDWAAAPENSSTIDDSCTTVNETCRMQRRGRKQGTRMREASDWLHARLGVGMGWQRLARACLEVG